MAGEKFAQINIRLTVFEKELLDAIAKHKRTSITETIRQWIFATGREISLPQLTKSDESLVLGVAKQLAKHEHSILSITERGRKKR